MAQQRAFAIADIHGCCRTFRKLLKSIDLKKTEPLFLLGDYIDRGQDSKGVIDTILRMRKEGFDVRAIRGNHEDMLLTAYLTCRDEDSWYWLQNGGDRTLKSYGVSTVRELPVELIAFLESMPLYCSTSGHVLVHAGLDFHLEDPFSAEGGEAMLWRLPRECRPEKIQGRKLVVGHTIRDIHDIVESLGSDIIMLDNGCFHGAGHDGIGNLVALELSSNKLSFQKNIDMALMLRRWYDFRSSVGQK